MEAMTMATGNGGEIARQPTLCMRQIVSRLFFFSKLGLEVAKQNAMKGKLR